MRRWVRKRDKMAMGIFDEENPTPVIVVGDPTSEGGTDDGCCDDGESVDCEGLASFLVVNASGW